MMKKILLTAFFIFALALHCFADEANDIKHIELTIKEATVEFEVAKEEQDLKKLATIAQNLYENHQLIKKLLNSVNKIDLLCNGESCTEPTLQVGDNLTIIFNLSFETSEEYVKNKLIWQVQHNKKVIKKGDKDIYEKGGIKKLAKEITIDKNFKDGKYRIAMHHKSETGTTKGEAFFNIISPLAVKNIVVSTDKDATASDDAIYPDEDIFILSGFKLENPSGRINIDVKLVDSIKQEALIETSFIRPKEDNIDPDQRLRFRIPASKLYKKQKLEFEMKLYGEGINPIVRKVTIPIEEYKLIIAAPNSLKSGKKAKYSIKVPSKFIEPYKVDIEPTGGILLSHMSQLTGVIKSISKKNEIASIYVSVTGAKGKRVSLTKKINLSNDTNDTDVIVKGNEFMFKLPGYTDVVTVTVSGVGKTNVFHNFKSKSKNFRDKTLKFCGSKKFLEIANSHIVEKVTVQQRNRELMRISLFNNGYVSEIKDYYTWNYTGTEEQWCRGKLSEITKINSDGSRINSTYNCIPEDKSYYFWQKTNYKTSGIRKSLLIYHANGKIMKDIHFRTNDRGYEQQSSLKRYYSNGQPYYDNHYYPNGDESLKEYNESGRLIGWSKRINGKSKSWGTYK